MASDRAIKIIMAQIKKCCKEPDINLIYYPSPDNIMHVWCLARNLDAGDSKEWSGGHFLFLLELPADFPISPPKFKAYNENGVYAVGTFDICIGIGHYHKDSWKPTMGLGGFAREIVNGMMQRHLLIEKGGLNLLTSTNAEIENYCAGSLEKLKKEYADTMEKIEAEYAGYSAEWDLSKLTEDERSRLPFGKVKFQTSATTSTL